MPPYPFTALPCQLCNTFACLTPEEAGHDSPVTIALAHASRAESTLCGLFCGPDSPFNTLYFLHSAAMALKNIAAFLAGNPGESATGPAAIRRVCIKVDLPDFVAWYEAGEEEKGPVSPSCAGLLRALDNAAARVGECGEYRPEVKFVLPDRSQGAATGAFAAQRSIDQ